MSTLHKEGLTVSGPRVLPEKRGRRDSKGRRHIGVAQCRCDLANINANSTTSGHKIGARRCRPVVARKRALHDEIGRFVSSCLARCYFSLKPGSSETTGEGEPARTWLCRVPVGITNAVNHGRRGCVRDIPSANQGRCNFVELIGCCGSPRRYSGAQVGSNPYNCLKRGHRASTYCV